MQHLEDTIAFRKTSYEVLQRVPDRDLEEADADDIPRVPDGVHHLEEQRNAVDLGTGTLPIVDIQAAFGAGETVVGAIIAARRASDGKRVVMMASTNAAVAQFAQTLLSLTAFRHLHVLRFVYDAAAQENLTPTPVDMNQIPMSLGDEFDAEPTDDEKALCSKFKAGRSILERYIENPDLALICRRRTRRSTPSPSATSPT
ncbi:hypothetical protein Aduo_012779 [Ancylostoma duodenale]